MWKVVISGGKYAGSNIVTVGGIGGRIIEFQMGVVNS